MSFSFSAKGTKEQALEQLEAAEGAGDPLHFELCRTALRAAIETIPEGNTVEAAASGHHDYTSGPNLAGDFTVTFSTRSA